MCAIALVHAWPKSVGSCITHAQTGNERTSALPKLSTALWMETILVVRRKPIERGTIPSVRPAVRAPLRHRGAPMWITTKRLRFRTTSREKESDLSDPRSNRGTRASTQSTLSSMLDMHFSDASRKCCLNVWPARALRSIQLRECRQPSSNQREIWGDAGGIEHQIFFAARLPPVRGVKRLRDKCSSRMRLASNPFLLLCHIQECRTEDSDQVVTTKCLGPSYGAPHRNPSHRTARS